LAVRSDDELEVIEQKLDILQKQLTKIDGKLNRLLDIARDTLILVQSFPDVIEEELDEQERDKAYRDLDSDMTVFASLSGWDGQVGQDALRESFQNWRTLIAFEARVDQLVMLPKYGEFLRIISKGDLAPAISSDIKRKLPAIRGLLKFEVEQKVAKLFDEARQLKADALVVNLRPIFKEPWVEWERAANRRRLATIDSCTHVGYHDPDLCHTYEMQPDTYWNRKVADADDRMKKIGSEITFSYKVIQTLQVIIGTLEVVARFRTIS